MKQLLILVALFLISNSLFAQESSINTFRSDECKFSAQFPEEPIIRKDSVQAQGNLLKITEYIAFSESGVNYSVTCNDFPMGKMLNSKSAILNTLNNGVTPRIGGEIQQIEEFEISDYHGISYIEESTQFTVYHQILLFDQKLLQIYVSGMNHDAREEAEEFYKSFEIN
ncbi:hypothetical protein [Gracilimonas sp. BCB1]|uniref:hypothetical protein n=1 Tax=Gracilimonas sp. BCB1 TaxID=3152362 RepID=UPI0032D908D1